MNQKNDQETINELLNNFEVEDNVQKEQMNQHTTIFKFNIPIIFQPKPNTSDNDDEEDNDNNNDEKYFTSDIALPQRQKKRLITSGEPKISF